MTELNLDVGELPSSYGKDRLVLLAVDPYLLHAYWDLSFPATDARAVLRLYESPESSEESRSFDVEVTLSARNWYVHLWTPDKFYCAELGVRAPDGGLQTLARSNTVRTPAAHPKPPFVDTSMAIEPEPPEPVHPEVRSAEPETAQEVCEVAAVSAQSTIDTEQREPEAVPPPATPPGAETHDPRLEVIALLERRLAEFAASREELPPVVISDSIVTAEAPVTAEAVGLPEQVVPVTNPGSGMAASGVPFQLTELSTMDLTQYSELRFTPGLSSRNGSFVQ